MGNKLCVGLVGAVAGGYLLRRQGLRWGATDEEVRRHHPRRTSRHSLFHGTPEGDRQGSGIVL